MTTSSVSVFDLVSLNSNSPEKDDSIDEKKSTIECANTHDKIWYERNPIDGSDPGCPICYIRSIHNRKMLKTLPRRANQQK